MATLQKETQWDGLRDATQARAQGGGVSSVILRPNELLFQTGDVKAGLYWVDSGAVCLYEPRWHEQGAVIDFAFPGDLVGLGFLETHADCARAVVETQLTCLPLEALASLIEHNPKARLKLDEAIEREFEFRRASLKSHQQSPLARVAAFLVSVSRINAHEGRDPWMVDDVASFGFVADLLSLSIPSLASILVELERRDLIEPCPPAGLRLRDISALEELTAQHVVPICPDHREEQDFHRERAVGAGEQFDSRAS